MNALGYMIEHYVVVSAVIFTLGAIGFLVRRNVLVQLMSIELMLNAVNLALVAYNRQYTARHERPDVRLLHHRRGRRRGRGGARDRARASTACAAPSSATKATRSGTDCFEPVRERPECEALQVLFRVTTVALLAFIVGLPLLGAVVNGVFGKRLGTRSGEALAGLGTTLRLRSSRASAPSPCSGAPKARRRRASYWHGWQWIAMSSRARHQRSRSRSLCRSIS